MELFLRYFEDIPQRTALALDVHIPRAERKRSQTGSAAERRFRGRFDMNAIIDSHSIVESPNSIVPEGIRSLVRGAETELLEQMMPVVRRQSVRLDLSRVERIDAAGIAALISLYRAACEAGRCFGVTNPTPHVREVLRLVGVDRFLMNESSGEGCPEPEMEQSAA